ncbi:hypothetical protein [Salmonella enterica]|uniref:hypothetical protein n=1 Tax=Salmonella enterica TaxID=28901 RepID=UPI0015E80CFF|nr:hypothetical protein [Salmonella enterica]
MENPQLGWGSGKLSAFKPVIKTPFDLLKQSCGLATAKVQQEIKRGPNGGRKELSAHPMEL